MRLTLSIQLSIPAFEYLFDQGTDPSPASWKAVDNSYCDGIWTPGKTNPNQGVDGNGAAAAAPAMASSAPFAKMMYQSSTTKKDKRFHSYTRKLHRKNSKSVTIVGRRCKVYK